jgi:hypothetical protein
MDHAALLAFADVLLPGDDLFPAVSATSIASVLDRLPADIHAAIAMLPQQDPAARRARVAQIEAEQKQVFADAQKALYLAYYEQPETIAAIRAMGIAYHSVLLPEGYNIAPFDAARDTPRHQRGRWTPTEQVERLDLSALEHLKA